MSDELITLGEALGAFTMRGQGPVPHSPSSTLRVCGAEINVAVGVRRLGHTSAWIGRIGRDPIGDFVIRELRAESVTALVERDPAPTALMLKEHRTADLTRVHYWRTASAGSLLSPVDIPEQNVREAKILHVSGITPASGTKPREALFAAIEIARDQGVTVSFDVNYRSALWSAETAGPVLRDIARHSDIVFCGVEEARLLLGDKPGNVSHNIAALGPQHVLVKKGAEGASLYHAGQLHELPATPSTVVDLVGAGDAFAAGYLSSILSGMEPRAGLDLAIRLGGICVGTEGDWEGLPFAHELTDFAAIDPVKR